MFHGVILNDLPSVVLNQRSFTVAITNVSRARSCVQGQGTYGAAFVLSQVVRGIRRYGRAAVAPSRSARAAAVRGVRVVRRVIATSMRIFIFRSAVVCVVMYSHSMSNTSPMIHYRRSMFLHCRLASSVNVVNIRVNVCPAIEGCSRQVFLIFLRAFKGGGMYSRFGFIADARQDKVKLLPAQ